MEQEDNAELEDSKIYLKKNHFLNINILSLISCVPIKFFCLVVVATAFKGGHHKWRIIKYDYGKSYGDIVQ